MRVLIEVKRKWQGPGWCNQKKMFCLLVFITQYVVTSVFFNVIYSQRSLYKSMHFIFIIVRKISGNWSLISSKWNLSKNPQLSTFSKRKKQNLELVFQSAIYYKIFWRVDTYGLIEYVRFENQGSGENKARSNIQPFWRFYTSKKYRLSNKLTS